MIRFDTRELAALSVELGRTGFRLTGQMQKVFTDAGDDLVEAWASNARSTAGEHGKHYPDSIDKELLVSRDIVVEVGPNPDKPQGGMSFEFGSSKQPPHLDGQHAADEIVPRLARRVEITLGDLGL